jgi:hypothetical protein
MRFNGLLALLSLLFPLAQILAQCSGAAIILGISFRLLFGRHLLTFTA